MDQEACVLVVSMSKSQNPDPDAPAVRYPLAHVRCDFPGHLVNGIELLWVGDAMISPSCWRHSAHI